MSQTFTTIATFDQYIEAHLYKNYLEAAGISCFLADEHLVSINPLLSNALGGIKLKVLSLDVEESQRILKKQENMPYYTAEGTLLKCPTCHSLKIAKGFKDLRGLKRILLFILALFTSSYPLLTPNKSFCKDCQHIF